jgi:catechol 2,3-dioxygenase-like lactoylglutathione lyase family enzyme
MIEDTMSQYTANDKKPDIRTVNTILYCDLFEETVRFYKECLEFQEVLSKPWFVEFAVNPYARLSVADRKRTTMESSGGQGITITFQVDDLHRFYERLKSMDLKPTDIREHSWGAKLFHIHDPEGHRLEFWTAT